MVVLVVAEDALVDKDDDEDDGVEEEAVICNMAPAYLLLLLFAFLLLGRGVESLFVSKPILRCNLVKQPSVRRTTTKADAELEKHVRRSVVIAVEKGNIIVMEMLMSRA